MKIAHNKMAACVYTRVRFPYTFLRFPSVIFSVVGYSEEVLLLTVTVTAFLQIMIHLKEQQQHHHFDVYGHKT